jgi:hypothetical protein
MIRKLRTKELVWRCPKSWLPRRDSTAVKPAPTIVAQDRAVEAIAFGRFATPNELANALSSKDDELKLAAEHAMKSIGHVRSSYWDWFENEEYFTSRRPDILFVGFQETLDRDIQRLKSKLGIAVDLRLPDGDVEAHRTPSNLDVRLDQEAVENLRRWYADEYKFVELCKRVMGHESA